MARSPCPETVATTPLPHWRWTTSSPGPRPRSRAPRWRPARRSAGVRWASQEARAARGAGAPPAAAAGGGGGLALPFGHRDQPLGHLLEEAGGQVVAGRAE